VIDIYMIGSSSYFQMLRVEFIYVILT